MTFLKQINEKIYTPKRIFEKAANLKKQNKKIVFTNGCFDILHLGHIDYMAKAAQMGDFLIIGLNSDASVKIIKGENRPLTNETSRSKILASLFFVDAVVLFSDSTPLTLIEGIKPDFLVKGNDYKPSEIVGYDFVTSYGGKVVTLDFLDGYSTTLIENKILKTITEK